MTDTIEQRAKVALGWLNGDGSWQALQLIRDLLAEREQRKAEPTVAGYSGEWQLVPVEPPSFAAFEERLFKLCRTDDYAGLYRAMLAAAAPEPVAEMFTPAVPVLVGSPESFRLLNSSVKNPTSHSPPATQSHGNESSKAKVDPPAPTEETLLAARLGVILPAPSAEPVESFWPTDLHQKTLKLVKRFSYDLAWKLRAAQVKYGYSDGWMRDDWMDECRTKLREHVEKGDPRDVAAYCAFLWHHGESTAGAPAPESDLQERLNTAMDACRKLEPTQKMRATWMFGEAVALLREARGHVETAWGGKDLAGRINTYLATLAQSQAQGEPEKVNE